MTGIRSYFSKSTLVWINLDRSTGRRTHMSGAVAPLFGQSERVPALDGESAVSIDECKTFVDGWRRLAGTMGDVLVHTPPGENFRLRTQQANIAIKKSHVKALTTGLNIVAGREKFFVAEDDIAPRQEVKFDSAIPLPPADADVAIWSGGLPMAATTTDDKDYVNGRLFTWQAVTGKNVFNCLGAGLYEVTPKAAHAIIDAQHAYPMSFDHAWAFALAELNVYRLKPNAFAQVGESIRNGKDRKPILYRSTE